MSIKLYLIILILNKVSINKDENAHRFALSGELLERVRERERKKEREEEREKDRVRATNDE